MCCKTKFTHAQTQTCSTPAPAAKTTATATPVATPEESPTAAFIPEATAYYAPNNDTPTRLTPPDPSFVIFAEELRSLTERIALNPHNKRGVEWSLCDCRRCPYSTGTLSLQRYNLLTRAFQINHMWSTNPHLQLLRDPMNF